MITVTLWEATVRGHSFLLERQSHFIGELQLHSNMWRDFLEIRALRWELTKSRIFIKPQSKGFS